MFGKLGEIMKQAKDVKSNMAKAEKIASETMVNGASSGDFVRIVMTAQGFVESVHIEPIASKDVEMLEILVKEAFQNGKNNANLKLADIMKEHVGDLQELQSLLSK